MKYFIGKGLFIFWANYTLHNSWFFGRFYPWWRNEESISFSFSQSWRSWLPAVLDCTWSFSPHIFFISETSQISQECIREMKDHRQMLLDDYKLSPEIVSQCSNDITNFCQGLRSKTIQCLMEHSHPNRVLGRVSFPCQKQVSKMYPHQ